MQVCELARHFVKSRMPRRIKQQCFNNTVVNIAACQLQGRMLHLWKSMHYQGWQIPAYDLHFRQIDVSLDKANDLGDKDLLHMIRDFDKKCSDMVADYFQYHMVCLNPYLTRLGHSQETACPSTHRGTCYAVMTQFISCLDDPHFRDGSILFVTFLRNNFRKSLETHGVDNEIKLITVLRWRPSYFTQWMSCNLFTHLAWVIPDAYPEVGDDGLSIPNNVNTFSTLSTMSAERLVAFPPQITSKLHCTSPKKTGARRLFHSKID